MSKGRYGGPENRRSPRFDKRFTAILEYEGKTHEIRTIDISEYGILIPKRIPPPIGTLVKLTLTIRDETSTFDGLVVRHTKCLVNGVETTGVGINVTSPDYQEFVKNKIIID